MVSNKPRKLKSSLKDMIPTGFEDGFVGENILGLINKASKRREWIVNLDRASVDGLTIDQVQQIVYSQSLTEKDLPEVEGEIKAIYDYVDKIETSGKKIIYLILLHIFDQRHNILSEHYQRHFAMWLIDRFGIAQSTAYKDAKIVETLYDYPEAVIYLTKNKVSNFLRKFRDIAYAPDEIKESLIKRLPDLTMTELAEEIAAAGGYRKRAKYEATRLQKLRIMRKKNEVVFKSSDPQLLDELLWMGRNLTRQQIRRLLPEKKETKLLTDES